VKTKIFTAIIIMLFLLVLMFPSPKAEKKKGCVRYFGWGSDADGSAHCMSEEAALPSNPGGVTPQGPLTVTAGQLVTFAINWSEWHEGPNDWAIYIGTISGTISYPPYNVPYPRLVNTTLLANWTNDITVFGDPPTVTGPYVDNASYLASGILPNYNAKILPNINSTPFEVAQAWVSVKNIVTVTIPTSLVGTYTIRFISRSEHALPPPPGPNDETVLGNPLITLWGWSPQGDPNGYPWGEFVDMTTVVHQTVYIRADGTVDPSTAPISSADNVTYAFTGNINDSIEVERSNIMIDGKGYTVQGNLSYQSFGISLHGVSNVTIKEINIKDFYYGIVLDNSSNNSIYHNSFIGNTYQVHNYYSSTNIWNAGYPSGGNYWSDYVGEDLQWGPYQNITGSDGIGDTPYIIDAHNKDNHPLMSPYEYWSNPILGDINKDTKVDNKDLSQLAAAYSSTPGKPNWNPHCDFNGDNRVDDLDLFNLSRNYGKTKP
jgi:parallel beta-helix repeat protein